MAKRVQPPMDRDEFDEGPSAEDVERFGGVTRPCPVCKAELYDDAELCWKCGHALSNQPQARPVWIIVMGVIALALIVLYLVR
ncbi:MAG: hypothetical protein JSR77_14595 [Planctomycetes bacterium]|nr:hypothetical protein [Planctomycetota bacterium]